MAYTGTNHPHAEAFLRTLTCDVPGTSQFYRRRKKVETYKVIVNDGDKIFSSICIIILNVTF